MNMKQEFTTEEFEQNFDDLMNRVSHGETLIIKTDEGRVAVVPYDEVARVLKDCNVNNPFCDHDDGC